MLISGRGKKEGMIFCMCKQHKANGGFVSFFSSFSFFGQRERQSVYFCVEYSRDLHDDRECVLESKGLAAYSLDTCVPINQVENPVKNKDKRVDEQKL